MLVQLLQTTPVKQEKPPVLNYQTEAVSNPYQSLKRSSVGLVEEFSPKRSKVPHLVPLPYVQQQSSPRSSNNASLMELLTEKSHSRQVTCPSVLENLLVSGHDSQTGHDLHGHRASSKSPSRLDSVPKPVWLKVLWLGLGVLSVLASPACNVLLIRTI